ncbi:ABA4-like family protein [Aquibium microcysteis]|uniref:ABA4-like family protein n=1 Tax=Aquibium microcysteis TaxID=675281 RepID=UPI00165D1093|nr:ABA4-like family protein [Aquibium microcysteis]
MDADLIFGAAGMLAMAGWLALLASPLVPRLADAIAVQAIPLTLSVAYAGLILAFWTSGEGGFDSLDNVARLFETRELLLAGWLHYLAFDLFVGAWIVRTARSEAVPFWMVLPCLPATFLFGPAGYLAFAMIRYARAGATPAAA